MSKFFEKYEELICYALIIVYLILNIFCMNRFGLADYRSTLVNTIFTVLLLVLIIAMKRTEYYGLTKVTDWKNYLYFIPLMVIVSANIWNGIHITNTKQEILFYILTMCNVGFIEEVIFLGFLFNMMAKSNVKRAIIVSSLTFGMGHIVNLLNGAELISTLLQIGYAFAIGYLFVTIYYRSKSLIPCIIAHAVFNSLSVFNIVNTFSRYIIPVILMIVPLLYAWYINKKKGSIIS